MEASWITPRTTPCQHKLITMRFTQTWIDQLRQPRASSSRKLCRTFRLRSNTINSRPTRLKSRSATWRPTWASTKKLLKTSLIVAWQKPGMNSLQTACKANFSKLWSLFKESTWISSSKSRGSLNKGMKHRRGYLGCLTLAITQPNKIHSKLVVQVNSQP